MAYLIMTAFTVVLLIFRRTETSQLISSFFSLKKSFFSPLMNIFACSSTVSLISISAWISSLIFTPAEIQNISIVYLVVVSVIIVPFAEEFFFRGILLGFLLTLNIKKFFAVILSAVLFALFHPPESMIFAFAGGVMISFFTVMSGSFRTGLMIHYANNLHAFADVILSEKIMIYIDGVIIFIAAACGIILLIRRKNNKYE